MIHWVLPIDCDCRLTEERQSYQEALMRPVISPANARLRRQMRHILNFRKKARGRPQSGQRLYCRTLNLGFRFACAIFESLAIGYCRKGTPKCLSSAVACSSFLAVVTKVTLRPFTFSIWS